MLWSRMVLRITEKKNGEVEGEADLSSRRYSMNRRVLPGTPAKLRGRLEPDQVSFSFTTSNDIQLTSEGPTQKTTFRATINEEGVLSGTVDYPGCGKFFAAGAASAAALSAGRLAQQEQYRASAERAATRAANAEQQREANRVARRASGWVPVELRPQGGRLVLAEGMLEYSDARLASRSLPPGVRPIDELHQTLFNNGEKCLSSSHVAWSGQSGTASSEVFGRKSFVIDCKGNCQGLRYEPVASLPLSFHGGGDLP
ncbi:MAG: hypothetical protein ACREMA_15995, partial [Longimicrobiales bacterium]